MRSYTHATPAAGRSARSPSYPSALPESVGGTRPQREAGRVARSERERALELSNRGSGAPLFHVGLLWPDALVVAAIATGFFAVAAPWWMGVLWLAGVLS